jgi:c-di-GMP-binding flagellar brake protein YcgR
VSDSSKQHVDRREYPRTKVCVPTELHLPNEETLVREQTSDLSLGGCYVKTIATMPVGTKLGVSLWLGEEKLTISAMVVTCHPQDGNGIQFLSMLPRDRDRVRRFLELKQAG